MKMKLLFAAILISISTLSFGQTCSSTVTTTRNFSAIAWTSTGGASCPPAANFTGNIFIDVAAGVTITMTTSMTINGNFRITNTGVSVLVIPSGVTVHVTGNMGDPTNNSMTYRVHGSLVVDGTLSGKNNNIFEGNGSIGGGTLSVFNNATCGTPCPVTGNFDSCSSGSGGNAGAWCTAVLPIRLMYFNAKPQDDVVLLKWATNMEENFLKFLVQRSGNGLDFEDIGEVAGQGFNIYDIESKYSFTDDAPLLGKNYYRLKAVDIDDSFEYFAVKLVELKGSKKLAVYPNPSLGNAINFRTNFNPSESDRIVLTNQLGVEIFNARASSVKNNISFADKLQPGIYMLRYVAGDFEQTERIFVKN